MAISLKAARINKGLTREEVVKSLPISKNTLASYEQGKTSPSIEIAQKLAEIYGLTINEIQF